jgi:hypothetical protein
VRKRRRGMSLVERYEDTATEMKTVIDDIQSVATAVKHNRACLGVRYGRDETYGDKAYGYETHGYETYETTDRYPLYLYASYYYHRDSVPTHVMSDAMARCFAAAINRLMPSIAAAAVDIAKETIDRALSDVKDEIAEATELLRSLEQ